MRYTLFLPPFTDFFSCIASFANVFTRRAKLAFYERERKKISNKWNFILSGRSRCDHCNEVISPFFLVPVFGYFFSGGKCLKCKSKISPIYPVEESVSFLYGFLFFFLVINSPSLLIFMPFFSNCILIFFTQFLVKKMR